MHPEPGETPALTSPPTVPLFGHIPAFVRNPLGFFTECAERYGDWTPLRFGSRRAFLATHPDLIEAILVAKHRSFRKSAGLRRSSILFGKGLLTAEGDFWRKQRRLIQPAFHRERIAASAQTMVDIADRHLQAWQSGSTFDLHADMMRLTMDVAVQTLFGTQVREVETVARALETGQELFSRWMHYLVMLPDWIPTPRAAGIDRAVRDLNRVVYGIIEERRASGDDRGDLLSMLLQLEDADDGQKMSERQLRDEILTLFLAGHETTALNLTWTFVLLAQNPRAAERLHDELDAALAGRLPAVEDLPNLTYTDQVIRESMRLCPPAWVVGREALEDVEIDGRRVPAGASVIMPQYVVHRDPRFFPNPEQFHPERWTPEFTRCLPKYAYFPFGGGPRFCIGNTFAMMESVLLLAAIASRFRLSLVPGKSVTPQAAFTLRPHGGVAMEAAAR
jgi:cytochrome P450